MTQRLPRRAVIGAGAAGIGGLFAGCFGSSDPPWEGSDDVEGWEIKIGVLAPESGSLATLGTEMADGVRLVQEQFEAVEELGYGLDLAVKDTESDPDIAVERANELADEGYQTIVGPGSEESAEAVVKEVLVPEQIVAINPLAATSLVGIDDDDLFWSTAPRARRLAVAMARPVATTGTMSVSIISTDNEYGRTISEFVSEEVGVRGTEITAEIVIDDFEASSYVPELEAALDPDPEGIILAVDPETGIQLLTDYYDEGFGPVNLFLSDRLRLPQLPDIVGNDMNDVRVISLRPNWHHSLFGTGEADDEIEDMEDIEDEFVEIDDSPPILDEFFHAFVHHYDRIPTIQAAQAFDATVLLTFAAAMVGEDFYEGREISNRIPDISNQQEGRPGVRNFTQANWWEGVEPIGDGIHNHYRGASGDTNFYRETGELDSPSFHLAIFDPESEFGFEEVQRIFT